jgi:hypothetical protein
MVLTLQSRLALSSSKGGVLRATPPYNPPYKPISFLLLLLGFLSISLSLSSESRLRRQPTISFLLLLGSLSLSLSLSLSSGADSKVAWVQALSAVVFLEQLPPDLDL